MVSSNKYCPSIDGLRGVAILLVLGFHFSVPGFNRGYLGVDAFFVISGFLITTLIVNDSERRTGAFRFLRFWMRRVLRLLPLYYLYIAICATGFIVGAVHFKAGAWGAGLYVLSLCFYFSNFCPNSSLDFR